MNPGAAKPYTGDPRSLFAAERTLLAWQRSGIALMGFGFVVERFGLFLHLVAHAQEGAIHRGLSLTLGVTLILMGAFSNLVGFRQFRCFLMALDPTATPPGYWKYPGLWVSAALATIAVTLAAYFLSGA